MKKAVMIFLQLFFFVQTVICQNRIIYESKNTVLSINFRIGEYSIWEDSDSVSDSDQYSNAIVAPTIISDGKINVDGKFITCIDRISGMKISLKRIDEYRLLVTNKSNCLNENDTLYASVISDQNGINKQWLEWKEGKRDGLWSKDGEKGVNYTLYEDGQVIKEYFKTYKQLSEERYNKLFEPLDNP